MTRRPADHAFVEIPPGLDSAALRRALYHTYRLSEKVTLVVWHSGHSLDSIEQEVQVAVEELGTRRAGIRYLHTEDDAEAAACLALTQMFVRSTARLDALADPSIPTMPIDTLERIAAL